MADEQEFETITAPALGPGDDDPRSPVRGAIATTAPPLGPGDTDPRSPDDGMVAIHVPALGPGDTAIGTRTITRVPRVPRTE